MNTEKYLDILKNELIEDATIEKYYENELIEDATIKKYYETTPENIVFSSHSLFTKGFTTELNSILNMHGNSGKNFRKLSKSQKMEIVAKLEDLLPKYRYLLPKYGYLLLHKFENEHAIVDYIKSLKKK